MSLGDLKNVGISFVVIGVVFAFGLVVLAKLADNASIQSSPDAWSAINNTIDATAEIPNNWMTIIAVVVAGVVVLGLVLGGLGSFGQQQR